MSADLINIQITDRAGVQKALFSSSAAMWGVISAEFDTKRDEGCGAFKMEIDRDRVRGTILPGYLLNVEAIQKGGGTLTRYWSGELVKVPKPGHIGRVWEYEAVGIFDALERLPAFKYYDGAAIDDAVLDILADIDSPVTALSTSTSEISIASPYVVADIESDGDDVAEVYKQLAIMQGDVQYGVDQNRKFYMKDILTDDVVTFVVGKNLTALEVFDDLKPVYNDIYLQSKDVVSGGQVILHDADSASVAAYGTRSRIVQLRNTKSMDDAIQYLASVIAREKDLKRRVSADIGGFSKFIFPRGNARIIALDGTEYSFPIQRVRYKIDGTKGLTGSVELGDLPEPTPTERDKQIRRLVERQSSRITSLVKLDHTRGEEFAQQALVDARKNGKFNIFQAFLTDLTSFDITKSTLGSDAFYDNSLIGTFGYAQNIAISRRIATAQVVDEVRLHTHVNNAGRIDFGLDSDLTKFFQGDTDDWRVDETGHALEQFQNAFSELFYREGGTAAKGTPWQLPANHGFRIRIRIKTLVSARPAHVRFGWQDANNNNNVILGTTGGNFRVIFQDLVAGIPTFSETIDTPTTGSGDEFVVRALYTAGSGYKIAIFDTDETTLLVETAFHSVSVPSGSRQLLEAFWNATDGKAAQVLWYEPQSEAGANTAAVVSRDDGVTWSSAIPLGNSGQIEHVAVDLSGQPSDNKLRVRFGNEHPGRILGWAISW